MTTTMANEQQSEYAQNEELTALVAKAKKGDSGSIERLVNDYKGLIRALANKFYLVGGDKEDLLQEGMLGLFYAINGYESQKGSFPSFAKRCVSGQIVDAVKRDSATKNKPLANYIDITKLENVPSQSSPLGSLLSKEYAERVAEVMDKNLTAAEKQVLELFAEGYGYDDIAEITGRTYKAVDGALQRARRKLAAVLERD